MKIKTGFLFSLVVIFLFPVLVNAQISNKDFDSIRTAYARMSEYAMELEYKLYPDHDFPVCMESTKAWMKKKDNQYYYKVGGTEALINQDYVMIVSHKNRTFMIDKYENPSLKRDQNIKNAGIDSLIGQLIKSVSNLDSSKVTLKEKLISKTEKQYSLYYSRGEYTSVSFVYDVNTYLVKKAVLYYRKKMRVDNSKVEKSPRLEMIYSNIQQHPKFNKDTFSEKKFVNVLKDGKLLLSPALASYSVINHLDKK